MPTERIIDQRDALNTLLNDIAPKYFSTDVDQNRISTFGYVTEALSHAWADSIILEQNRAEDYCPELSSNETHVRQTAKLREIGVANATPYTAYATLYVTKEDILEKLSKEQKIDDGYQPFGNGHTAERIVSLIKEKLI